MVAPSDMMDGRIGAIKTVLIHNGLEGKVPDTDALVHLGHNKKTPSLQVHGLLSRVCGSNLKKENF